VLVGGPAFPVSLYSINLFKIIARTPEHAHPLGHRVVSKHIAANSLRLNLTVEPKLQRECDKVLIDGCSAFGASVPLWIRAGQPVSGNHP
jgi:hypothetical protein